MTALWHPIALALALAPLVVFAVCATWALALDLWRNQ